MVTAVHRFLARTKEARKPQLSKKKLKNAQNRRATGNRARASQYTGAEKSKDNKALRVHKEKGTQSKKGELKPVDNRRITPRAHEVAPRVKVPKV